MTQSTLGEVKEISQRIKQNPENIALYKERRNLYSDLLELNFDNASWDTFADKYEADLSRIIQLERTPENLLWRAGFLQSRIFRLRTPQGLTELYPRNRFFDQAAADYEEALKLDSSPQLQERIYSELGGLYTTRSQKLASAPNAKKWLSEVTKKLIIDDILKAIEFSRKALEISGQAEVERENLAAIYMTNTDSATKLGMYGIAAKLTKDRQNNLGYK